MGINSRTNSANLIITKTENESEIQWIRDNLAADISDRIAASDRKNFAFVARNGNLAALPNHPGKTPITPPSENSVIGGIAGVVHWEWVYIAQLWVAPEYRKQKIGFQLVQETQNWAKANSYLGLYVDTFELTTKAFYESLGFQCFGVLPNFPEGGQRFFLNQTL